MLSDLTFPQTIALFFQKKYKFVEEFANALRCGEPLYTALYIALILFFAYFYVGIVFNPTELADNMRKYGGFIPGIRPGRNTSEHINRILTRLTFVGGCYLALVCMIPEWMIAGIRLHHLWGPIGAWFERVTPEWILNGLGEIGRASCRERV